MKLAAMALGILACAWGQTPSLKKLNVVATDKNGQPVTNLQTADLQVFEDGKAKETAYFRFTGRADTQPTVILMDFLSDRTMSDSVIGRPIGDTRNKLEPSGDVSLYVLTNKGAVFRIRALPGDGEDTASADGAWSQHAG